MAKTATPVDGGLVTDAIMELLASKECVVLERLARGGGATNWYLCRDIPTLEMIQRDLAPGSIVSLYFDDRIRRSKKSPQLAMAVEKIIAETGDAIVGVLGEDGFHLNAETVVTRGELPELMSSISETADVFYGAFPARDNDGARAITVTIPDRDGIVRHHPH